MYARHSMEMQSMSGFGIKDSSTEDSLGWKCFGKINKDREFCTFNDKYVRAFIRRNLKGGRCAALSRYFESNQCEKILDTIKELLKSKDNEISNLVDEY